ncbi:unnamed protein product [Prunus armeniaca]
MRCSRVRRLKLRTSWLKDLVGSLVTNYLKAGGRGRLCQNFGRKSCALIPVWEKEDIVSEVGPTSG